MEYRSGGTRDPHPGMDIFPDLYPTVNVNCNVFVYVTIAYVFQVSIETVLNCNVFCHRVGLKHTLKKRGRAFRNIGKYTSLTVKSALLFFRLFVLELNCAAVMFKFLGDAEWAALSEQERQKRLVKLRLEERRLRKENQMDELQKLLGEGFEMDANLRKLMGENKAR